MVYVEKRPWGSFELYNSNKPCTVKILNVRKNKRLSLQYHNKRTEHWVILDGKGKVQIRGKLYNYKQGDSFKVPRKTRHRISASANTRILEIAYGTFDENDIIRIADDFGRA